MTSIVTYGLSKVDSQCEIDGIQFGIMSESMIRQLAVVECDEVTLYTRGVPTPRGVLDHRMGTVDRRMACGTCGENVRTCPGHWGRIELPLPVFHVSFYEVIRKIMTCVCYNCARIRLSEEDMSAFQGLPNGVTQRKQRLSNIYSTCRHKKNCSHCSSPCPVFSRSIGLSKLVSDWGSVPEELFECEDEQEYATKLEFTAQMVHEVMSSMSDEDVLFLGLDPKISHPKNMILSVLLVPPPIIRPSIMVSEGSRARGQDDLTIRLLEIIKRVTHLRDAIEEAKHSTISEVDDLWEKLSIDVSVYMHNNPRGNKVATQRSGVPIKCLFSRLKGKGGRFRSNLMGKRVNFSGRSVISPDPLLDVDEVGVPEQMALSLTIQETVNDKNIQELSDRVTRGPGHIDGAETVIPTDGTSIQLEFCTTRDQIVLQNGWIVERPIHTGDWVIFNRQPTLHRSSLMGHRVVIVPGKTIRCNLAVVSPYNADFDGDEMNIHVPQSPAAISEVKNIMSVTQQLVSPQASKPVIGIVQDALLGAHLMTSPDVLLDTQSFMSIVSSARNYGHSLKERTTIPAPVYEHPTPLWTGKQLIEYLMPRISVIKGKVNDIWEAALDDGSISAVASHPLVVRNGRFLSGQLNKSTIGISMGSLVHNVLLSTDNKTAAIFMGDVQRVVNRWILERGFSIGIGDCVPSRGCGVKMTEGVNEAIKRIDTLQTELPRWSSATLGDGDRGRVSLEKLSVERTIHRMVGRVQMSTGALVRKEMSHGNGLGAMVQAGSKGNNINICQIMLCVGQNCVNGERITRDGSDKRTLPGYAQGDVSVDGAGFVSNSYLLGLTASEAFFHAKGGREGLVDTSVKTSRTGYLQRRLVKGMESHRAEHDLTVRDACNNVVEFIYGGDGMSPAKLERYETTAFSKSDKSLLDACVHSSANTTDKKMQNKEWRNILETRDECRRNCIHVLTSTCDKTIELPVNPKRVLLMVVANRTTSRQKQTNICVKEVCKSLNQLIDQLNANFPSHATCNLRLALLYELRSFAIVNTHCLTVQQWEDALRTIRETIQDSIIEAGEMVGCIAAQSIGEPATQMSCRYSTPVTVCVNGVTQKLPIGKLIDSYLPPIQGSGQHDVMRVNDLDCIGVSPHESTSWTNVTHVSRHPANGSMITVVTKHGRSMTMTASHSFLVRKSNRVVPRKGHDLIIGDSVPVVKSLPTNAEAILPGNSPVELTCLTGKLIGSVLAAGGISNGCIWYPCNGPSDGQDIFSELENEAGLHMQTFDGVYAVRNGSLTKWMEKNFDDTLPAWIIGAPDEFIIGILRMYVQWRRRISESESVTYCYTNGHVLSEMLCLCLARFGIASSIENSPVPMIMIPVKFTRLVAAFSQNNFADISIHDNNLGGSIPGVENITNELQKAGIKQECMTRQDLIGLSSSSKTTLSRNLQIEIHQAIHAEVWWDEIVDIRIEENSTEMVYDFTVNDKLQSFMLSNGVFVHNTLNTFHLAGVAMEGRSQLSGIPRVSEIIDASRNIKTATMTLRMNNDMLKSQDAEIYARSLEHCLLSRLVATYEVEKCPRDVLPIKHPEDSLLVAVERMCSSSVDEVASPNVLRLVLNRRLLKRRGLIPSQVLCAILNQHLNKVEGIASPEGSIEWVVRLRATGVQTNADSAKVYSAIMSTTVVGGRKEIELAELIKTTKAVIKEGGELVIEDETAIETAGSDMSRIAWEPELDWERCTSNDVMDIYNTLGIAAAKTVIFHELKTLVAGDSSKVNDRHIMLVATSMTHYGTVMPMNRHGINRVADTGPLMKCSFEETSEVLTDAGVFSESDHMRGVSQSIMMGRTAYIGTGCCDVVQSKTSTLSSTGPANTKVLRKAADGSLQGCGGQISKSRFRGKVIRYDTVNSQQKNCQKNMDPNVQHESSQEVIQCEPPYLDDSTVAELWSATPGSMPIKLADSPESLPSMFTTNFEYSETVEQEPTDNAKVRESLIDAISRVSFSPPRSPVIYS